MVIVLAGFDTGFFARGGKPYFLNFFGYFRTAEQTNSVIVIPWVVGVYQDKCPCHEGAARVPGRLFRYSPSVTMV